MIVDSRAFGQREGTIVVLEVEPPSEITRRWRGASGGSAPRQNIKAGRASVRVEERSERHIIGEGRQWFSRVMPEVPQAQQIVQRIAEIRPLPAHGGAAYLRHLVETKRVPVHPCGDPRKPLLVAIPYRLLEQLVVLHPQPFQGFRPADRGKNGVVREVQLLVEFDRSVFEPSLQAVRFGH